MNALYYFAQYLHWRGKRRKDASSRILAALDVIRAHAVFGARPRVVDIGPRNDVEPGLLAYHLDADVEAIDLCASSALIRRGDMHALPYAADRFDLCFVSHALEHSYDLNRACREIGRVVRPGGYVWVETPRLFTPSAHDRHRIEEAETLIDLFREFRPEIVWSEVLPHKLRALVRLWKTRAEVRLVEEEVLGLSEDGTVHARWTPKVMILLADALAIRNWAASGLVDLLMAGGVRVVLAVPGGLLKDLGRATRLDPGDRRYTLVVADRALGGRLVRWLRRQVFRTASYVARAGTSPTYRHKLSLRRALRHRLEIAALRLLHRVTDAERLACRLEAWLPPCRAARRLIAQEAPDLLVTPTTIVDGLEVELVKAAKLAGVKVLVVPASFDTLTSKGAVFYRFDAIAVWGERSKQHALDHHGIEPDRVFITGPPHFDVYAR